MSVEHPPSHDSGGTRISTKSTIIDKTRNMVLSAIPLESGHLMIQQQSATGTARLLTNSQQQQQNGNTILTTGGNFTQIHRNSPPKIITTSAPGHLQQSPTSSHHTVTKIIGSNNNGLTTSSKYVIFQPNSHYTTSTNDTYLTSSPNTTVIGGVPHQQQQHHHHQSNGVGNIVIVATEPMDINHNEPHQMTGTTILNNSNTGIIGNGQTVGTAAGTGTGTGDEELTSLSWLTDKNLIKGLVPACPNKAKLLNNASNNNNGTSPTSNRQLNGITGSVTPLSPTSDFMEDSSVSDEIVSSANSSPTDQGICIRTNDYHHKSHQHHIQYTNNNNNNNNTINKNRNHIIAPINGATINSPKTALVQQTQSEQHHHHHQQQQHSNLAAALGATTTVHVGPSGTTTVVEYKTQNYLPATSTIRHIPNQQVPHSPTTRSSPISANTGAGIGPLSTVQQKHNNSLNPLTTVVLTTTTSLPLSSSSSSSSSSLIPKSPSQAVVSPVGTPPALSIVVPPPISTATATTTTTTTTTHHPHKKYLREQMNGLDQNQNQNHTNQSANNTLNNIGINLQNINVQYAAMSSPNIVYSSGGGCGGGGGGSGISTTSSQISNQSMYTISESPPRDYIQQHHSTPIKSITASTTPASQISYSEYDNDSLKDYEVPNGTSSSSSSSINGRSSSSAQKQHPNHQQQTPSGAQSPSKQKHPINVPYDPLVHTNSKPPYSFSSLIFMAIEDSPEKALPVKEIYAWIVYHFPYFKTAPTGWKNSVRHNLSLNKSFLKVEKAPNMGKGSLWRVEQMQRPNLLQALARSPFHPCSAVDQKQSPDKSPMTNSSPSPLKNNGNCSGMNTPPTTPVKSNLDARLFPKLSKMMKEMITKSSSGAGGAMPIPMDTDECQSNVIAFSNNNNNNNNINNNNNNICNGDSAEYYTTVNGDGLNKSGQHFENVECSLARDCGADSIDDVNAATAMLALKHGPKVFTETFNNGSPVITNSPSEDHTYSAGGGSVVGVSNNLIIGGSVGIGNIVIVGSNGICSSSNSSRIGPSSNQSQNGSDILSNGGSSDAAYESSEESHNITAEELERQRRVESVDALLSLSSMFDASTIPSPIKRPSSLSVEQDHISSTYMENIPHLNGKGILAANSTIDEGYNTLASYCGHLITTTTSSSSSATIPQQQPQTKLHTTATNVITSMLPKKLKQSRGIRTKIKRKAAWIR